MKDKSINRCVRQGLEQCHNCWLQTKIYQRMNFVQYVCMIDYYQACFKTKCYSFTVKDLIFNNPTAIPYIKEALRDYPEELATLEKLIVLL